MGSPCGSRGCTGIRGPMVDSRYTRHADSVSEPARCAHNIADRDLDAVRGVPQNSINRALRGTPLAPSHAGGLCDHMALTRNPPPAAPVPPGAPRSLPVSSEEEEAPSASG